VPKWEILMANLGRKPELRARIDAALDAFEKGEVTDDDALALTDWSVVQHATSSQACRFERAYEGRYSSTPVAMQRVWLKVFRIRFEQSARLRTSGPGDAATRMMEAELAEAAEAAGIAVAADYAEEPADELDSDEMTEAAHD
jgi:hypothetical protein